MGRTCINVTQGASGKCVSSSELLGETPSNPILTTKTYSPNVPVHMLEPKGT